MRFISLRWVFLFCALVGAGRCLFLAATPGRLAFTAVCALAWRLLSRRKALSLDRETLGLPPRG